MTGCMDIVNRLDELLLGCIVVDRNGMGVGYGPCRGGVGVQGVLPSMRMAAPLQLLLTGTIHPCPHRCVLEGGTGG